MSSSGYMTSADVKGFNAICPGSANVQIAEKVRYVLQSIVGMKDGKRFYVDPNGSDTFDGLSWDSALKTVQAAVNKCGNYVGNYIIVAAGSYDETVTVTHDKGGITIIGEGPRGACGISTTTAGAEGMFVRANDVTLINFGVSAPSDADYALKITGDRFRAYACKFEGADTAGKCVHVKCGTSAEVAANTDQTGSDALFDDCEFAWGYDGIHFQSSDYGSCTQNMIRKCRFHNNSRYDITETDTGGAGAVKNIEIQECVFDNNEDGSLPTKYIHLDAAADTGIICGNSFGIKDIMSYVLLATGVYFSASGSGGLGLVPGVDSTDNITSSDVIGNKSDTSAGTSIIALEKAISAYVDTLETNMGDMSSDNLKSIKAKMGDDTLTVKARFDAIDGYVDGVETNLGDASTHNLTSIVSKLGDDTSTVKARFDTLDGYVDGVETNLGDASGHNLTSVISKFGDDTLTVKARFDAVDGYVDSLETNIGDASGDTIKSLVGKLGNDTSTVKARFDTIDGYVDNVETNIGDPSGHNLVSITAKFGDDTNTVKTRFDTLDTNLGDASGDTIKSIVLKLGNDSSSVKARFDTIDGYVDSLETNLGDASTHNLTSIVSKFGNDSSTVKARFDTIDGYVDTLETNLGDASGHTVKSIVGKLGDDSSTVKARFDAQDAVIFSSDSSGSYSYLDAGGEQTVVTITTSTRKIINGVWLDLVNMTQNGTIKAYYKIDGSTYRLFYTKTFTVLSDPDGTWLDLNIGITNDFKITYEEGGDEAADRAIPYSIIYEVKE